VSHGEFVLGLGDDALIAAQRLAEWCSRAHEMEEDVALTNIALDQLGAARLLLSYAGELEGAGRGEDELAYLREDGEFRNVLLVELPNYSPPATLRDAPPPPGNPLHPDSPTRGDFAVTITKLLFLAASQRDRYQRLATGGDERLAAIAAKAVKESTYHLEHAALWTIRLGDGTAESHRRMQRAVDELWPYTYELCEDFYRTGEGDGLRPGWLATVEPVLAEATLTGPADGGWAPRGGREGRHTEHLSYLLAEMQVLHRAHAGAAW
jgi:ring-1,2-phenylacetyl-CoA epoxidase subunit PaaC